ncbi:MAG: HAMP domain-containing histidine kinase [Lachnospiraceae bacterium]|nr:HAMP domain-containing histidine kinase [Lachnospiraceae bacterium]
MRIFADKNIKQSFFAITVTGVCFLLVSQLIVRLFHVEGNCALWLLLVSVLAISSILAVCIRYVQRQDKIMEEAVAKINAYLDGDTDARIDCDSDGELYRLFQSINTLASVLSAHAAKEQKTKESLKNIISDISHQLKTPLAALNIYNSLLQEETGEQETVMECAMLSERELDRIETLIQNMLKIAKLDAGFIIFDRNKENVADMMKDIELHFAYRAKQEQKEMVLSGADDITFFCDRDWLVEAVSNIVKNAFEHTKEGDSIYIEWKTFISVVQITVRDNGCGIHPEDLHHIFKRFYRSRFSKDTQGTGLGLPLAKGVVEAHNGTIEVDSVLGSGTAFVINFLE